MKKNYLKAIVILHGKSELQIFNFIKSIQITSLMRILNNVKFRTQSSFLRNYEDVEWDTKNKCIVDDFKIFIIMDTDDCTEKQKTDYMNKNMFKDHWAYKYIKPINNTPELETVLTKAHISFTKKKNILKYFQQMKNTFNIIEIIYN